MKRNRRAGAWFGLRGVLEDLLPSRRFIATCGRVLLGLSLAAVLAGAVLGALEVKREVEASERFFLDGWSLDLGELPEWVTPEIEAQLGAIDLGAAGERLSLFQKGVLRRLGERLESSPWVRAVTRLKIFYPTPRRPGIIDARLTLRVPVALVEAGGMYYLTDGEGLRLGEPYRTVPRAWFGVPVVTGAREPLVPPPPGGLWGARDVLEGVHIARILYEAAIHRDFPERPIEAIDVSNVDGRRNPRESEVALLSEGRLFQWGRSPRSAASRTLPLAEILDNLRAVLGDPRTRQYREISLYTPRLVGVR
jgi:hypothetical protein